RVVRGIEVVLVQTGASARLVCARAPIRGRAAADPVPGIAAIGAGNSARGECVVNPACIVGDGDSAGVGAPARPAGAAATVAIGAAARAATGSTAVRGGDG